MLDCWSKGIKIPKSQYIDSTSLCLFVMKWEQYDIAGLVVSCGISNTIVLQIP